MSRVVVTVGGFWHDSMGCLRNVNRIAVNFSSFVSVSIMTEGTMAKSMVVTSIAIMTGVTMGGKGYECLTASSMAARNVFLSLYGMDEGTHDCEHSHDLYMAMTSVTVGREYC